MAKTVLLVLVSVIFFSNDDINGIATLMNQKSIRKR